MVGPEDIGPDRLLIVNPVVEEPAGVWIADDGVRRSVHRLTVPREEPRFLLGTDGTLFEATAQRGARREPRNLEDSVSHAPPASRLFLGEDGVLYEVADVDGRWQHGSPNGASAGS